jgi:hypothetical protein
MANVFGILTMIVLLLAGFVAFKNKERYASEITETNTQKENLKQSQLRFETAKTNLADTIAKREEVDAENVKLASDQAAQEKTNKDLEAQIADKTSKRDEQKQKLDEIREKTAKVGNIQELAPKMKASRAELEQLAQDITAAEAKLANLTSQNNSTESQIAAMKKMFDTISSGSSLPTVNTRIRSIYPTWGFVTLASGNAAGVVGNSTLDVVRDGNVIAKLLVTAVEANSASASIIPDSIVPDTTLMVGDRVVPTSKGAAPAGN